VAGFDLRETPSEKARRMMENYEKLWKSMENCGK
jgi:hypothetical protein